MPAEFSDLNILGIAGSLREHSASQLALDYAIGLLGNLGCRTRTFDLRSAGLPFCDGNPAEQARAYPAVEKLRQAVAESDALVLVTPEYHNGISGVLKNALDLLETKHLSGKIAGVVSVLGGPASTNAWNDLSRIMRACHAWVVPQYVAIGHASEALANGQILDMDLQLRFHEFIESLAGSAARLRDLVPRGKQILNYAQKEN